MAETITVTGLRETQRALYSVSQQLGDKVVLGSLKLGANLVKRQAQINVPVRTGRLKRLGIRVGNSRFHRGKSSKDMIGVFLTISRRKRDRTYYGWFQEQGYRAGRTTVPGKRFLDAAWLAKRTEAVELIRRSAIAGAEVLARKTGL